MNHVGYTQGTYDVCLSGNVTTRSDMILVILEVFLRDLCKQVNDYCIISIDYGEKGISEYFMLNCKDLLQYKQNSAWRCACALFTRKH